MFDRLTQSLGRIRDYVATLCSPSEVSGLRSEISRLSSELSTERAEKQRIIEAVEAFENELVPGSGEGDPGEGDPGEGDPGEGDPGEGDPGEGA